jgi:hypothetical protein
MRFALSLAQAELRGYGKMIRVPQTIAAFALVMFADGDILEF